MSSGECYLPAIDCSLVLANCLDSSRLLKVQKRIFTLWSGATSLYMHLDKSWVHPLPDSVQRGAGSEQPSPNSQNPCKPCNTLAASTYSPTYPQLIGLTALMWPTILCPPSLTKPACNKKTRQRANANGFGEVVEDPPPLQMSVVGRR